MALTNATVQYVPAIRPGNAEAQLVKRMHFVSFVGMFRADLLKVYASDTRRENVPSAENGF